MKKILIGLCFILFIVGIKVKASEVLITTPNIIDNEYICNEEYIQNSNVNWNSIGQGSVYYYNKTAMSLKTKDVYIKDLEDLKEGINIPKSISLNIDEAINVSKIVNVVDGEFFILGKIDAKTYPYETEIDKVFAYIAYYKNNAFQWSKVLRENRYGSLVDGVVTEDGIAVIGEYDSPSQKSNVYISIISLNAQILYDKEISGSLNEYANNIYYKDGLLIFCGVSQSKDYDFSNLTPSGYDIFVGNINLASKEFTLHMIGNKGNDNLLSSIYNNGFLYIYAYLKGGGFFYDNDMEKEDFKCIIKVDNRHGFDNLKGIESLNDETNEAIFIFNGKIVVSNFSYGTDVLTFRIYDEKMNFEVFKSYTIPNINRIIEYKVIVSNENLYITTISSKENNKMVSTTHNLDKDYLKKSDYNSEYSNTDSSIIDLDCIDGKLKIVGMDRTNSILYVLDYFHLVIGESRKDFASHYLLDYDVYINGSLVNKKIVSSDEAINPFGFYTEVYSMEINELELVLPIEKYYYPNINLKNKEVYDLGVTLKFNGIGYLNDEAISTHHKILEAGKYVFEIIGSNGERKVVNFDIANLSIEPVKLEDEENIEMCLYSEYDYSSPKLEISINENIEAEIDNIAIIIIFLLAGLGIVLGLVLPFNISFWRRKNV